MFIHLQGRIQDFFRRGCTRLLFYFNTNKPHSFFIFWQNTSCIRKPQVILGGGGAHPLTLLLDPPLICPSCRYLPSLFAVLCNRHFHCQCLIICCHTVSNGNRTEWSPIRSVIIRVINKIGRPRSGSDGLICLITSMITDRIGRHEVLLPINHNFNKICDI